MTDHVQPANQRPFPLVSMITAGAGNIYVLSGIGPSSLFHGK